MIVDRLIRKRRVSIYKEKLRGQLLNLPFYIDEYYKDIDGTSFIILSKNTETKLYILYDRGEYFGYYIRKEYVSGLMYFYSIDNLIQWLKECMDTNLD